MNDLYECVGMMSNFIQASEFKDDYDAGHATAFAKQHLSNPDGITLVLDDGIRLKGMLAAAFSIHPFVPIRTTHDLCWWVEPDTRSSGHGLELLRAYEYWARDVKKADLVILANRNNPGLDKLYASRGYTQIENSWTKRL